MNRKAARSGKAGTTREKAKGPPPPDIITQPSRLGTKPITAHFPQEVRDQLKILAIEQGTTMHKLIAEFFNDGFAKYKKPKICPTDSH